MSFISALIIESDREFAATLSAVLSDLGFLTAVVSDGAAGLAAAAEETPNLIVLCAELPQMTGYAVCNKLKNNKTLKKIPLILMSSDATPEIFEQHRKLKTRADEYIVKSSTLQLQQLVGIVRNVLPDGASLKSRMAKNRDDLCDACGSHLDDDEQCVACRADNTQRPLSFRYFRVEGVTKCGACNNLVPVNGAFRHVQCDKCMAEIDLLSQWAFYSDFYSQASKFFTTKKAVAKLEPPPTGDRLVTGEELAAPACRKCKQSLPAATISLKTDGFVRCARCGESVSVFPTPPWLKEIMPKSEQFFCAERDSDPAEGQVTVAVQESAQPMLLQCPGCGGNLTLSAETERSTTCEYCQAAVYLPAPLWNRLHPVKSRQSWYLRLRVPAPKNGNPGPRGNKGS